MQHYYILLSFSCYSDQPEAKLLTFRLDDIDNVERNLFSCWSRNDKFLENDPHENTSNTYNEELNSKLQSEYHKARITISGMLDNQRLIDDIIQTDVNVSQNYELVDQQVIVN